MKIYLRRLKVKEKNIIFYLEKITDGQPKYQNDCLRTGELKVDKISYKEMKLEYVLEQDEVH